MNTEEEAAILMRISRLFGDDLAQNYDHRKREIQSNPYFTNKESEKF